jgi:hypothetical protein
MPAHGPFVDVACGTRLDSLAVKAALDVQLVVIVVVMVVVRVALAEDDAAALGMMDVDTDVVVDLDEEVFGRGVALVMVMVFVREVFVSMLVDVAEVLAVGEALVADVRIRPKFVATLLNFESG